MREGCLGVAVLFTSVAITMIAQSVAEPRSAASPTSSPSASAVMEVQPPRPPSPSPAVASVKPQSQPPRPTQRAPRTVLAGVASWYDDGPGLYAAVNSFRFGDRPYRVTVWYQGRHVTVVVRDHCNCYTGTARERVIDLAPEAFAELAPLSRGLIKPVEVRR